MLCSLCKPFLVGDHSIAKHRHELPRVIPTHATHPKRPDVHCQLADSTAETPSPLPRRAILSLAAAAMALASGGIPPSLAASPSSVGASPLPQTFTSSEGFEFSFPNGWVVAYDRSGGRGDGAVVAVGDFTRFLVVSVFRTVDVPDQVRKNGLDDASGRTLCLDSLAAAESTMRFKEIRSEAGANRKNQYDFEYEIETCRGEIQEGSGGVLRCLGGMGQGIPTIQRHHVARAVLSDGHLLTINAAAPLEKWAEVEDVMRAIVNSYQAV